MFSSGLGTDHEGAVAAAFRPVAVCQLAAAVEARNVRLNGLPSSAVTLLIKVRAAARILAVCVLMVDAEVAASTAVLAAAMAPSKVVFAPLPSV